MPIHLVGASLLGTVQSRLDNIPGAVQDTALLPSQRQTFLISTPATVSPSRDKERRDLQSMPSTGLEIMPVPAPGRFASPARHALCRAGRRCASFCLRLPVSIPPSLLFSPFTPLPLLQCPFCSLFRSSLSRGEHESCRAGSEQKWL